MNGLLFAANRPAGCPMAIGGGRGGSIAPNAIAKRPDTAQNWLRCNHRWNWVLHLEPKLTFQPPAFGAGAARDVPAASVKGRGEEGKVIAPEEVGEDGGGVGIDEGDHSA